MQDFTYLIDVIIIISSGILFVLLTKLLRASSVTGYLVAGMVIGPFGALLVKNQETIHLLAEFGVIFLLFSIGLEFPLRRLFSMRWHIFGLGLLQVLISSLVIGMVAFHFGLSPAAALATGTALALSSTATVLQLLLERNETASRFGRLSIAVLIFQDLAVVPLLVLVPMLKTVDGMGIFSAVAFAGVKATVAVLVIVLLGRFIARPLFRLMAYLHLQDIFIASTLLVILCASMLTASMGMSMALGAFLAGLLLGETKYRHQVEADIHPFRGLFLGLFFMSIGMSLNLPFILDKLWIIIILTAILLLTKALITSGLCLLFRQPLPVSVRTGVLLAQHSEFGFVLFALMVQQHILSPEYGQIFTGIIALSMASTPLLTWFGKEITLKLEKISHEKQYPMDDDCADIDQHVIIAGFGRVGRIIGNFLSLYEIPYVALDTDSSALHHSHTRHLPVFYGNASHLETLKKAGINRASAVAVTLDSPQDTEQLVTLLKQHYPTLPIITRAHDLEHKKNLEALGVTAVIPDITESSLMLGAALLETLGTPPDEVQRLLLRYRQDNNTLFNVFSNGTLLEENIK